MNQTICYCPSPPPLNGYVGVCEKCLFAIGTLVSTRHLLIPASLLDMACVADRSIFMCHQSAASQEASQPSTRHPTSIHPTFLSSHHCVTLPSAIIPHHGLSSTQRDEQCWNHQGRGYCSGCSYIIAIVIRVHQAETIHDSRR